MKNNYLRKTLFRLILSFVLLTFIFSLVVGPKCSYAQTMIEPNFTLPTLGTQFQITSHYQPMVVKGLIPHQENALLFDFIVDPGDDHLQGKAFVEESQKLIKYFLAALTIPEDSLWVNLSPYEKNRIIAQDLGRTEMGRDLLAEDYVLKQLAASLTNPETDLGKKYWSSVPAGETQASVAAKVWIVPDRADVYEKNGGAFVVNSHLKVMMQQDYEAMTKVEKPQSSTSDASSAVFRELILPQIEREVNEGKTFLKLRQMYHAMILATWFKKRLKESLLSQVFVNKGLTRGVDIQDPQVQNEIYNQYVESFKQGVYSTIKEDVDSVTEEVIPRKYFSGGFGFTKLATAVTIFTVGLGSATDVDVKLTAQISPDAVTVRWQGVEIPAKTSSTLLAQAQSIAFTNGEDPYRRIEFPVVDLSEFKIAGAVASLPEENLVSSSGIDLNNMIYNIFGAHPYVSAFVLAGAGLISHLYVDYSVNYLVSRLGTSTSERAHRRLVAIGQRAVRPLIEALADVNIIPKHIMKRGPQYDQILEIKLILAEIGEPAIEALKDFQAITDAQAGKEALADIYYHMNHPKTFDQVVSLLQEDSPDIQRAAALTITKMNLQLISHETVAAAFDEILNHVVPEKITLELAKVFDQHASRSQQIRLRVKALKAVGFRPAGTLKLEDIEKYLQNSLLSNEILAELRGDFDWVREAVRDQGGNPIILSDAEQELRDLLLPILMRLIEEEGRARMEYLLLDGTQEDYLRQWIFERLALLTRFPNLDLSEAQTVLRYLFGRYDQAVAEVRLTELIRFHEIKQSSKASAGVVDPPTIKMLPGQVADTMAFANTIEKTRFSVKDRTIRLENRAQDQFEMDLELIAENAEDQAELNKKRRELGSYFGAYVKNSDALWFVRAKTMMISGTEKPVLWIMEIHASRVWWKMQEKFRKQYRTMRAELINHLSSQAKGMGYAAVIIPDEVSARPMAGTLVGKMSKDVIGIFYKQPKGFDRITIEQEFNQRLPFELGHYIQWVTPERAEPGSSVSSPVGGLVRQVGGLVRQVGGLARPVGGIDLNALHLDLQIKRDPQGIPLPLLQQPLGTMQIEGFMPVIIQIQPVNLPQLLSQKSSGTSS